ncbi:MAG: glycosyltransferase family 4 protein [Nitrospira sp.]
MLGPAITSPGGIASVVRAYQTHGLFQTWPIVYVPTTCKGSSTSKFIMLLRALAAATFQLSMGRVRLVHIHSASYNSFWRKSLFIILSRCFRKPVVLHLHGGAFLSFYSQPPNPIRAWYIQDLLARVATLIVLSKKWKDALTEICPGIPIRIIGNPVIVPAQHDPRDTQENVPVILFMGRLEQAKGIWDLFEACANLAQRGHAFKLVCAGPGGTQEARSRASDHHLTAYIELPGWIEGATKHYWLSQATMLVLPSYYEGLPMSLLEAMAYRLPVIATAVGGIPDVIVSEENGILIQPGDIPALTEQILRIKDSSSLRQRLGDAALKTVSTSYAPSRIVSRLSEIYRDCELPSAVLPAARSSHQASLDK